MRKTKYIETKSQLIAEVEKTLKPVLDKVGERLLNDLRDQIDEDVYKHEYYPNKRYYTESIYQEEDDDYSSFPTGEFMDAWDFETVKTHKLTNVSGMSKNSSSIYINFNYKKLTKKPHKSIVDGTDVRKFLNKILNVDGYTSSLMVGHLSGGMNGRYVSKLRKPYWDNFIKKIKSKSLISKYMKQEAKKQGITLK